MLRLLKHPASRPLNLLAISTAAIQRTSAPRPPRAPSEAPAVPRRFPAEAPDPAPGACREVRHFSSSASPPSAAPAAPPTTVLSLYNANLASGSIPDEHQLQTVSRLDRLLAEVQAHPAKYEPPADPGARSSELPPDPVVGGLLSGGGGFFESLFSDSLETPAEAPPPLSLPPAPQGLYVHGGVGCGKTYTMDLFQEAVAATVSGTCVQKVHFHAFMLDVHRQIHIARGQGQPDPLPFVVSRIVSRGRVVCFDEFQVTDIADAMILKRLFEGLFEQGCVFVATSNRPPDDLYKNGINRDSFLPFIDLLRQRNEVVSMDDSPTDYRIVHGKLQAKGVYFLKKEEGGQESYEEVFRGLVGEAKVRSTNLRTQGRNVLITESVEEKSIARLNFWDMCGKSKGAADYLVIGEHFETIFISDVPKMELKDVNLVRRFITLIDALYECECKVVILSEARPEGIFVVDEDGPTDEQFAFDRTRSRLDEMMSEQWLKRKRKGKKL